MSEAVERCVGCKHPKVWHNMPDGGCQKCSCTTFVPPAPPLAAEASDDRCVSCGGPLDSMVDMVLQDKCYQCANPEPADSRVTGEGKAVNDRSEAFLAFLKSSGYDKLYSIRINLEKTWDASRAAAHAEHPRLDDTMVDRERDEEAALDWLDDRIRQGTGALVFVMTERGDIGLFPDAARDDESVKALGSGDTAMEAIIRAAAKETK